VNPIGLAVPNHRLEFLREPCKRLWRAALRTAMNPWRAATAERRAHRIASAGCKGEDVLRFEIDSQQRVDGLQSHQLLCCVGCRQNIVQEDRLQLWAQERC
jgi:hypothetical protein